MSTAGTRLAMRGVRKRFGATVALDGVDLRVRAGEVCALVGENGAGKSTLMKVLSGAVRPDAGTMTLDGRAYAPRTPADGRAAGVAMIYQELSLAPHLSVLDNLVLGVEPARGPLLDRGRARARARGVLERVGLQGLDLGRPVRALGTAARQRVEIARALSVDARVLVLDEPTSSLGREDVERLFAVLGRVRDEGVAVVYISHFLEEVQAVADRFVVLRDGRAVGAGDPRTATHDEIVAAMVGRSVGELYPRRARTPGEVVLRVDGLCGARFGGAALELRRGEVLGVAGLVGAGRTELLRALFALDPVRAGTVRVRGAVGPCTPAEAWRGGLGFVSEDRQREGLALGLPVGLNLALPGLGRLGRLGLVDPRAERAAAAGWAERLGIACASVEQRAGELSGGNQQKVALARPLFCGADVLFLDEPTRGVDVGAKAEIYRWIDRLAQGDAAAGTGPAAVLLVSSYLPELLGVCDRIAVMRRGRLGPARPVAERSEEEVLREAVADERAEVAP